MLPKTLPPVIENWSAWAERLILPETVPAVWSMVTPEDALLDVDRGAIAADDGAAVDNAPPLAKPTLG